MRTVAHGLAPPQQARCVTDPPKKLGGSDYLDAVRGVMERAAEVEDAKGSVVEAKTPILARRPVVITVTVVFIAAMFFNLRGRRSLEAAPEAEAAAAHMSVMNAQQVVHTYQQEHGELPQTLAKVGLAPDQFEYRRGPDGHFELVTTLGTGSVRYDSREGPEDLLRSMGLDPGVTGR